MRSNPTDRRTRALHREFEQSPTDKIVAMRYLDGLLRAGADVPLDAFQPLIDSLSDDESNEDAIDTLFEIKRRMVAALGDEGFRRSINDSNYTHKTTEQINEALGIVSGHGFATEFAQYGGGAYADLFDFGLQASHRSEGHVAISLYHDLDPDFRPSIVTFLILVSHAGAIQYTSSDGQKDYTLFERPTRLAETWEQVEAEADGYGDDFFDEDDEDDEA